MTSDPIEIDKVLAADWVNMTPTGRVGERLS
jgi:hypothetical protein